LKTSELAGGLKCARVEERNPVKSEAESETNKLYERCLHFYGCSTTH
jgi:hypothetical protein